MLGQATKVTKIVSLEPLVTLPKDYCSLAVCRPLSRLSLCASYQRSLCPQNRQPAFLQRSGMASSLTKASGEHSTDAGALPSVQDRAGGDSMASAELVKLRRRQTKVVVKAESASAASDSPAGAELVKEVKIKKSRQRKVTAKAEGNPTLPVPTEVLSEVKIRKPRERKMTAKARANLEPNMPASSELLAEVRVKRSRQRKVSGKAAADVAGTVVKEASDISLGPEADPLDIKIDPAILDKHCLGVETVKELQEEEEKPKKKKRSYANAYTRKGEGLAAAVKAAAPTFPVPSAEEMAAADVQMPAGAKAKTKRGRAVAKAEKEAEALVEGTVPAKDTLSKPKKTKGKAKKTTESAEIKAEGEVGEGLDPETPKPKRRRGPDPNAFKVPTAEILEEAGKLTIEKRPVPNLGFACLNATLRGQKPPLFTNRDCIKKTWEEFGLERINSLALGNVTDLAGLIHWNHLHGIRFFRMSSKILPWCTEWNWEDLPSKAEIAAQLAFAGELARKFDQRLTFHPSHFVKLGCEDGPLLDRSLKELEVHSMIFDLMGYEPSHYNKINIHIGGQYGDKLATIERFAKNFRRLSPNCQKRLTVENDDIPSAYSITDLMPLHEKTGIPLVFDFHHHQFCTGGLTEEEAFKKALTTWPSGVRPVVHWSESQAGRKPHAHSDFVKGPLRLYGLEKDVDVMIESKAKELALLTLRDPDFKPSAQALAAAITSD